VPPVGLLQKADSTTARRLPVIDGHDVVAAYASAYDVFERATQAARSSPPTLRSARPFSCQPATPSGRPCRRPAPSAASQQPPSSRPCRRPAPSAASQKPPSGRPCRRPASSAAS
jgi:hypothetical protein